MAQRRPVTSHPAFVVLIAVWFAALFGFAVAVLPPALRQQVLATIGLGGLSAWTTSGAAALLGGLLGSAVALALARRGRHDPRPIYTETEIAFEHPMAEEPARRPLRVREELHDDPAVVDLPDDEAPADMAQTPVFTQPGEEIMILGPQANLSARPAPDLDGLLAQFDTALAAFRSGDDERPGSGSDNADPVHAFVARQTNTPSPPAGRMPDHQAELRAALDKLARAQRRD